MTCLALRALLHFCSAFEELSNLASSTGESDKPAHLGDWRCLSSLPGTLGSSCQVTEVQFINLEF
jgi:hypothetical protein